MKDSKIAIEKNTVQETLVIPLYGRKMCSELYPRLFYDDDSAHSPDRQRGLRFCRCWQPENPRSMMQRFGFLEAAMRQNGSGVGGARLSEGASRARRW